MPSNRTSKSSSAVGLLVFGGFAACSGRPLPTVTELPSAPRRPDGVVIEPPPALPSPMDRVAARGIVALREPPADAEVEEVVRAYVRAFEREELDVLKQLLAQDAAPLGRPGGRQQLVAYLEAKIRNFEYQKLAGLEIARYSQIARYDYDSFAADGAPPRPPEMRPTDIYVRVPIATPRVGLEQLFGDVLVLLLRREEGVLRIAGQADELTR